MATQFYAYMYLRTDGTPFYIGKGSGKRAYRRDRNHYPPKTRSLILVMPRANEAEAFATEIELIRNWGRKNAGTGCLHNLTDGGENPPSNKGIPKSDNFRRLLVERNKGNKWAVGTQNRLGIPHTAASKAKLSVAGKGRTHTPETRIKLRNIHLGKPKTAEHKEKLRQASTGKTPSAETKAKMSVAQKARHDAAFIKTVAWG